MKIITRAVIDWKSLEVEEEESFDYEGHIALAKSSGSAPQPVDPWEQAAAQYALSTGTANFNAGLNRTSSVNPMGSSGWTFSGGTAPSSTPAPTTSPYTPTPSGGIANLVAPNRQTFNPSLNAELSTGSSPTAYGFGSSVAPTPPNTYVTQLAPQFESALQQPINTSQIPGMPGGPSLNQNVGNAENAVYNQQMAYLQPEQALQSEELNSQLAAEGVMPGSAAYTNDESQLARDQTFAQQQATDSAVTEGQNVLGEMYGLGSESLQNQEGLNASYINDFNALNGNGSATSGASTPDISGAFNQQYQGKLAQYNANTATNNQTDSTIASLAMIAAMMA